MRTLNLFGLLVAAACSLQACHSPESRTGNDSTAVDSNQTDTSMNTGPMASGNDSTKVSSDDTNFMNTAAIGGMMEVDLGKIAQKSSNAKVKAFAAQMVTDHTKANSELTAIALNLGVTLPTEYPAAEKEHMDMMKKMTGTAFDKHYIDMMVTDHDKTVALFKGATGLKKQISDFAKKTLPVIEGHDKKAKAIQAGMK